MSQRCALGQLKARTLQAVPLLASITGILIGCIFVSGLIGMQLFSEPYHRACLHDISGAREAEGQENMGQWGCGGARDCPQNYTCGFVPASDALEHSVAGFDNVGAAMLTAFQVCCSQHNCKSSLEPGTCHQQHTPT